MSAICGKPLTEADEGDEPDPFFCTLEPGHGGDCAMRLSVTVPERTLWHAGPDDWPPDLPSEAIDGLEEEVAALEIDLPRPVTRNAPRPRWRCTTGDDAIDPPVGLTVLGLFADRRMSPVRLERRESVEPWGERFAYLVWTAEDGRPLTGAERPTHWADLPDGLLPLPR